nr:hypothetical protein [uncultured Arsenicibacter sp.]
MKRYGATDTLIAQKQGITLLNPNNTGLKPGRRRKTKEPGEKTESIYAQSDFIGHIFRVNGVNFVNLPAKVLKIWNKPLALMVDKG